MKFFPLEHASRLDNGYMKPFELDGQPILLIQQNDKIYIIENKCGHFGIPLDTGYIKNDSITCSQHGFSFDLKTGCVIDRPYENCDAIKIFEVKKQGDVVGVEL